MHRTPFRLAVAVAALLSAAAAPARADDDAAEAKRLYMSGMRHFNLAEYEAALADFKEGYRRKDDPVFLYDIAQCYRLTKGHEEDAIKFYRNYLRAAPTAPNRDDVEKKITSLEQALAMQENVRRQPPSTLHPVDGSTVTVTSDGATAKKPVHKQWWLWTAVGAVVVVGGGVGVGLGVGLSGKSQPGTTAFPPVDF
jgi:tetratricopeptide (TPR) repeat protein